MCGQLSYAKLRQVFVEEEEEREEEKGKENKMTFAHRHGVIAFFSLNVIFFFWPFVYSISAQPEPASPHKPKTPDKRI